MMKLVLLLSTFIALGACGCSTACGTPPTYTMFNRTDLNAVRDEIRYYFPSSPVAPPPIFITDGANSAIPSLFFTKAASLSVTFMFEGAGNRNQLGYYVYDQGNIANRVETLLFRDIEADPKCVWTGMTVTSAVIPAGKRFGFYLISDGYCGGQQKYYLDSSLNTPNDKNIRHVGLYIDNFRELMIIGFEDLLKANWDNDFEDTMFIFDSAGVEVQFDGVPFACTKTPCKNGGTCDYVTGRCDCSKTKFTGRSCETCSCSDGNDCTVDSCIGPLNCTGDNWQSDIRSCLNQQSCRSAPCVTTGIPTTGVPTTGIPTTGRGTTGIPTTGVATTGAVSSSARAASSAPVTTGIPTTGTVPFTTGGITTGRGTTGLPTTGEIVQSTRVRPNYTESFSESGNVPTVSSDEIEGGAIVIGASLVCSLAVFLF